MIKVNNNNCILIAWPTLLLSYSLKKSKATLSRHVHVYFKVFIVPQIYKPTPLLLGAGLVMYMYIVNSDMCIHMYLYMYKSHQIFQSIPRCIWIFVKINTE